MDIQDIIQETVQRAGGPQYTRKRDTGELARRARDWRAVEEPGRVLNRMEGLGMHREIADMARAIVGDVPDEGFSPLEAIVGQSQLISSFFLYLGVDRSHAVGRIITGGEIGIATGFLISPRLLMTNNHVLPDEGTASRCMVQFDYILRGNEPIRNTEIYRLLPDEFFLTSIITPGLNLDYAIVAVEPVNFQGAVLARRGYIPLIATSGKLVVTNMANIIQHPGGEPQQVAIRDSQVTAAMDHFLQYEADTQPGSSGSPVFNDQWQLGALHHSGVPEEVRPGVYRLIDGGEWDTRIQISREQKLQMLARVKWLANEGIRISSIVTDARTRLQGDARRLAMFEEAVREREVPVGITEAITNARTSTRSNTPSTSLDPPGSSTPGTSLNPVASAPPTTAIPEGGGAVTWTIPLSVTVQLGPQMQISLGGTGAQVQAGVVASQAPGPQSLGPQAGATTPAQTQEVTVTESALARAREVLRDRAEVLEVRGGYLWQGDQITDREAIVVVLNPNVADPRIVGEITGALANSPEISGLPVDVTLGGASALLRAAPTQEQFAVESTRIEELFQERVPAIGYTPPEDVTLDEVNEAMEVTCHVSPDDGWPVLSAFLGRVKKTLTIGMYDLTAPQVVEKLKEVAQKPNVKINLAIERGASGVGEGEKKNDIPEEVTIEDLRQIMGRRFRQAYVDVEGPDRTFASAYHIKVAVRDGQEVWLSSGNMQTSNQPNIQPAADNETSMAPLNRFNRDWHVVILNKKLARTFEGFLLHDLKVAEENPGEPPKPKLEVFVPETFFQDDLEVLEANKQARYFPNKVFPSKSSAPVRVQPLLTPDNYLDFVIPLVRSAQSTLYIQNQSLSLLSPRENNEDKFLGLWEAIKERQKAGLDVRLIFRVDRRNEDEARKIKERLVKFGLKASSIRAQERCHTKGVIVDSRVVLLGSHNWTNQGAVANRDASLIFRHPDIAKYYEQIFLFDWDTLARQPRPKAPAAGPGPGVRESLDVAVPGQTQPANTIRVSLGELLEG
ncbi:MAG TPA: phospholipase D-like domain-containing protein [Chloroflexia bacterium]|jgi:V8-like Glu-specific endopeptidase